ncbi:hypothetical protein QC764_501110 [Podospora pseudoanserina]|uniref:Secreted protein n=1 Tax=Podospora pseudoanserina TaxID=2609844 RepID=A0ABR0I429_9PEZI|nr:hypothetical protein QC764_501110 [Podospora pseudoanserina]
MSSLTAAFIVGAAVLSGVRASPVASANAALSTPSFLTTIGLDPEVNITKRDVIGRLPNGADEIEHRFQPVLDFDGDGCYYTSAMDDQGNLNNGIHNPGDGVPPGCLAQNCREENRLQSNNVYSRARCNNGWCAIMYEYYFEKDQLICGPAWGNGHPHDWEHVIVFVQDDQVKRVAPSCHNEYPTATNEPRLHDGTRAKIVYHKDGGLTHCVRMAAEADDDIENYTGEWFLGELVGWNHYPTVDLRTKLVNFHQDAKPKLNDADFAAALKAAAGDQVPGFNPDSDS